MPPVAPGYSAGGGSPNPPFSATSGHIFANDTNANVFYFKAPTGGATIDFLGNQSTKFGGSLRFDLKAEGGSTVFNQPDVVLVGAGQTLVFDAPVVPDTNWRTYTVPLSEGGWRIGSLSGPAASAVDMQGVLAAVTNLYIRGEFRGTLSDVGRLDNVELLTPAAGPTNTFPANTEGWTVVDLKYLGVGSPPTVLGSFIPTWSAAGGNPNGHIFINDPTANVFYWSAPAGFLGNQSTSYGASLSFDLEADFGSYVFNQEDVVLVGGGKTLVFDAATVPDGTWRSYRIGLAEAGWRVGSLSGPAATEADMKGVLANITSLYIRGEFRGALNDIGRLDNVRLWTLPPPTTPDALHAGPIAGDFNDDGTVDANDYIVWRKYLGTDEVLPNDPMGGPIGMDQYNMWREHSGEVAVSAQVNVIALVPEPTTLAILLGSILAVFHCRSLAKNRARKF